MWDVIWPESYAFSLGWIVDEGKGNWEAYHEPNVLYLPHFLSVSLED